MSTFFEKTIIRLERIFKTDVRYLSIQSSWLISGQIIVFLFSFLLAWVFANFISPSDYGLYRYVLTVATLASITTLTGFGTAIARSVAHGHDVKLNKLLKIKIKYGFLGSILFVVISLYYFYIGNPLLATLFIITAVWIPFFDSLGDYQYILQGKKDFKTQTFYRVIQRTILTLVVISAVLLQESLIVITVVYFGTVTISQYFVLRRTLHKYPSPNDSNTPYQEIITYGKQLSVQNIFFIGVNQLDKILLFKFLGPAQLATYIFATALPLELQGVLSNVNNVVFPKLVNKHSKEFKYALLRKIFHFTLILLIPVSGYIFIAPYLFAWFFPAYTNAVFVSQLFVGTVLFVPASLLWHYFYAVQHKRALVTGTLLGPGALLLGMLFFIPTFGLLGAVLAVYFRHCVDVISAIWYFLYKAQ